MHFAFKISYPALKLCPSSAPTFLELPKPRGFLLFSTADHIEYANPIPCNFGETIRM
jgi:hypothetical protein